VILILELIGESLRFSSEDEIAVLSIRCFVVIFFSGVFKEDQAFTGRFFPNKKIFPGVELSQFNKLPVIQSRTPYGFFIDFKPIGLNENEFCAEGDASAPDTPGVTRNLGRN